MASKQRQVLECALSLSALSKRVGIHTFFMLPVWEKSMHGQRSRALRCASHADAPIPPGVLL